MTRAGTTNTEAFAFWDLFPTFLDAAHLASRKGIDGISLLPALKGQYQKLHDYLYWELHEAAGKQAVRMGNWKGIRLNVSKEAAALELYNLTADPQESINVAAQHPDVVKKIEALMKQAYIANKDWPLFSSE